MSSQAQPLVCPRCSRAHLQVITLAHHGRGIVFQGCSDCLVGELDVLASFRSPQCSTCGAVKSVVQFETGVKRLECPVHAFSKAILAHAMRLLEENPEARLLVADIRGVLGMPTREEE